ncbi:MgtC/SapB family protein [Paenibacillus endoradicis]|uniref:MgtC/SapB family protein n=1 Tax=Paenibacillus endoradicis TaxID=2972487 RepID=UPI002158FBEA|nr:MgtC/SapB family protein [Paenibacillus endoradicis]MCR8658565.1 MgtC/SapB family protein [Paenibacillus endoradicis]
MSDIWIINEIDLTLRVLIAAALGGLVGFEREWSNHAAGLRTHILVCIGSAVIMLLSIYGFNQFVNEASVRMDPARLAAQVISGIGFLGAGAIMRDGSKVSGLTTAASIWVVAAIGLCVGAGFLFTAVLTTVIVLISLFVLNKLENQMMRHRRHRQLVIAVFDKPGMIANVFTQLGEQGIQVTKMSLHNKDEDQPITEMNLCVKVKSHIRLNKSIELINNMEHVKSIEINLL